MTRAYPLILAAIAALSLGCRHDPVEQDIIDALGEEKGTPSPTHRPGQPCLACHDKYGGAEPAFAVAGTVFSVDPAAKKLDGAGGILVTLLDSAGLPQKACSNPAGNFYILKENWANATFPIAASAGDRQMHSLIGREGSCASCHKLPDGDAIDQVTGAAHDSPGVIVVSAGATDPTCGGGAP